MILSLPPRSPCWPALLPALLLAACDGDSSTSTTPCDLTLELIAPSAARPGYTAAVAGRPFTSAYDTAVYVGSARATVLSVAREGCESWDECLAEHECSGCDDCDACDPLHDACNESIAFTVPDLEPGTVSVQIFNRYGESNALPFDLLAPLGDTGAQDTGVQDTGAQDTGAQDTGPTDSGDTDTAIDPEPDSADPDVDSGETGSTDTAHPDGDPPAR